MVHWHGFQQIFICWIEGDFDNRYEVVHASVFYQTNNLTMQNLHGI